MTRHRRRSDADSDSYEAPGPAAPNKVAVGPSTVAGYTVTATGLATAIVAFLTGDRSEQTLGALIGAGVAVIAFAITQIGRYVQANTIAANQTAPNVQVHNTFQDQKALKKAQAELAELREMYDGAKASAEEAWSLVPSDSDGAEADRDVDGRDEFSTGELAEKSMAFSEGRVDYAVAGDMATFAGPNLVDLGADHPLPGQDRSLFPGTSEFEVDVDMRDEQRDYHEAFERAPVEREAAEAHRRAIEPEPEDRDPAAEPMLRLGE